MNIYPSLIEMVIQGLSKDARTAYDTMTDVGKERLVNHELFHMAVAQLQRCSPHRRADLMAAADRHITELLR